MSKQLTHSHPSNHQMVIADNRCDVKCIDLTKQNWTRRKFKQRNLMVRMYLGKGSEPFSQMGLLI